MPTLTPRDEVHLVRQMVRAPDFAIVKLLSDGRARGHGEIYEAIGEYSLATKISALNRLKRARVVKPLLVGLGIGWKLDEGAREVYESLVRHQKVLEKLAEFEKTTVRR